MRCKWSMSSMEDQQCMIMATLQIKENHSLYIVDNDPAVI
jgi:hypothetical protein